MAKKTDYFDNWLYRNPGKTTLFVGAVILILPWIFTLSLPWTIPTYSNDKTAYIGDTIGGITAPFIGLFSAYLVFISFKAQIEANKRLADIRHGDIDLQSIREQMKIIDSKISNFHQRHGIEVSVFVEKTARSMSHLRSKLLTVKNEIEKTRIENEWLNAFPKNEFYDFYLIHASFHGVFYTIHKSKLDIYSRHVKCYTYSAIYRHMFSSQIYDAFIWPVEHTFSPNISSENKKLVLDMCSVNVLHKSIQDKLMYAHAEYKKSTQH